ncbi:TonB-dependent receptor [Mucilaginibacter sp. JRF]|uniref:TonB-dependent receptor n=1 Tax=Mucilaginibacter sp. JRF TaxID=2780088 RepID=UPI00188150D2|nr:TonB-dependent receptor [Mucilaginibacter sp. JRF]MBE9586622.1 TonB-dependent receptor [Mucilaginibacter sp. JRF]
MYPRLIFTLIAFCVFISTSIAQNNKGNITGKVLTNDGNPAPGITIKLLNTSTTTTSQADGNYSINTSPGRYTIQFSAVGLTTKQIDVELNGETTRVADVVLEINSFDLKDVVVTGQYAPQSLKNSVYMVRTVSSEQIRLRNATKIQEVLSDQLGFRFSNDLTLGTADVSMMGVSGQRVKILLDGVPILDRGETREGLNQIDINTIDHVEIVDGPMSVSYGTDALGGVINLITKKSKGDQLSIHARVQEETAGKKYDAFQNSGTHYENVGLNWNHKSWEFGGNFSRNNFDGATLGWMPKDQWLGNALAGYRTNNLHVWYRLDGTNETLKNNGPVNVNTGIRTDAHYITYRWMHQLQAEWLVNNKLSINGVASYTDYSRRTLTTTLNTLTGDRRLTLGAGEQDKAVFDNKFFRATAQYSLSKTVSLQPGVEVNLTGSSGARINGTPTINDYAFFISSEIQPTDAISVRPGLRFIKNSVYDAPPVIPSINTKFKLNDAFDLRLAYARGFRSPALRELYFNFIDANHSIRGNTNLKAEYSNSFNGSVSWVMAGDNRFSLRSSLGGFYNDFKDLITIGYDPADPSVMMYINIDKAKTKGITFNNTINFKNLEARVGAAYIGTYNKLVDDVNNEAKFVYYPEVSSTLLYHFTKIKADASLFYKFNGTLPTYEVITNTTTGENDVRLAKRSAFSIADFTLNKYITKTINLSAGVKNLFNVTNVNNTSTNTDGAHSTGGPVPMGYGRSYFLGLNFQFHK